MKYDYFMPIRDQIERNCMSNMHFRQAFQNKQAEEDIIIMQLKQQRSSIALRPRTGTIRHFHATQQQPVWCVSISALRTVALSHSSLTQCAVSS